MVDRILNFYENTLNGPLYYVVVVVGIIIIFAIIGMLMENRQKNKKMSESVAVVKEPVISEPTFTTNTQTTDYSTSQATPKETQDQQQIKKNDVINFGTTETTTTSTDETETL